MPVYKLLLLEQNDKQEKDARKHPFSFYVKSITNLGSVSKVRQSR